MSGNKLVPSSGTCLCSMQGDMWRIMTLGEGLLPVKGMIKLQKICKKGSTWLDMRQARAIWLITQIHRADINLKKERKTHENEITT